MIKKNEKLLGELYKEMEQELDKEPERMDTEKIRYINQVIARLEGRDKLPGRLDKDAFFQRFDRKYGFHFRQAKTGRNGSGIRHTEVMKAAIAVLAVCVLAGVGNAVSVAAVDKSLWQILEETRYALYYAKTETEVSNEDTGKFVDTTETFSSWDAAISSVAFQVLDFTYLPDNMSCALAEKSELGKMTKLYGYFEQEDLYFTLTCEYSESSGIGVKLKSGASERLKIGGRQVYFTDGEDKMFHFEENEVFYTITSNLSLEELERIIENMK